MNASTPVMLAILVVAAFSAPRIVQAEGPDEVRGTLLFGTYTGTDGEVRPARYVVFDDGNTVEVTLAQYGHTAVSLPVRAYDRDTGMLELGWDGAPGRTCKLVRRSGTHYEGECFEGDLVMPMVIRARIREDNEMMGQYLEPSTADVDILDRAIEMFTSQDARNTAGDRNCDDDLAAGRVSLFCALFLASIEVTGAYLHRRPAMAAVRMQVLNRFPKDYPHLLRDVNNDPDIPDKSLVEALEAARNRLLSRLDGAIP